MAAAGLLTRKVDRNVGIVGLSRWTKRPNGTIFVVPSYVRGLGADLEFGPDAGDGGDVDV